MRAETGRGGYTLAELVVVLAIIALIVALVAPRLLTTSDAAEVRRAAALIETAARAARADARITGRDAAMIVDLQARTIEISPRGRVHDLPRSVEIEAVVADTELAQSRAAVRFFPDGGATGGRFDLAAGRVRGAVRVNWITGRTEHDPPRQTG
ncbi:MAG: prepilin-type N-terminal cleavage/methylation domain-containing protein [Maricaulaceae bacterium]|nr:prepilin-type N-terminal cleavage/methylation domain-containing protein [Maricaulaceae bacterium]